MKITSRRLAATDYELLADSLNKDKFHTETTPLFFVEEDTICNVYEDDIGPVLFLRGKGSEDHRLRIDIQFVSNDDKHRNMRVMLQGFPLLVDMARNNGFKKITFESETELLRQFCQKRLGFTAGAGQELEKVL